MQPLLTAPCSVPLFTPGKLHCYRGLRSLPVWTVMAQLEINATIVIYTCWASYPWRMMGGRKGKGRKLHWYLTSNLDSHLGLLGQVLFQGYFPKITGVMLAGNLTCYFSTRSSYFLTEQNTLLAVEATLEAFWVYGKFQTGQNKLVIKPWLVIVQT